MPIFFSQQCDKSTHFGANFQNAGSAEPGIITDQLKQKYVRASVRLSAYSGGINTEVQRHYNAGLRVVCNINWEFGNQPRMFPTGSALTSFTSLLRQFLDAQVDVNGKSMIWMVVNENEPDNFSFYNYDTSTPFTTTDDYLAELAIVVTECRKRDIKVTDGATHISYYSQIKNNNPLSPNAAVGKRILQGCALLNLDMVNTHWNVPSTLSSTNSAITPGILRSLSQWAATFTGHKITSNEWHQRDGFTSTEDNDMCTSVVTESRNAHFPYCIIFSGDGTSGAISYIDGSNNLNSLGLTYKAAVDSNI